MTRRIRFSRNRQIEPTAPDWVGGVEYGTLVDDATVEADSGSRYALSGLRLLPPCSPTKIVCVGRNYADHAKELGNDVPAEPLIFLKPPSSLIAHGDRILYPPVSKRVDYEGEIGLVIGRRVRNLKAAGAWSAVAGVTPLNDITARDLQKSDPQWTRGKGFDTFCAVGPWMVPAAEVDFDTLGVRTVLDGELKQEGYTRDLIFPVGRILEYITGFLTLEPGDLIATGTPAGVGPMRIGSRVSVEVIGVGTLENEVAAG
jgi:2-keto-4-pentenoate hydratase/2-oxohepta-3-ene-1,7-dioic acid hydratase in catechol pathway